MIFAGWTKLSALLFSKTVLTTAQPPDTKTAALDSSSPAALLEAAVTKSGGQRGSLNPGGATNAQLESKATRLAQYMIGKVEAKQGGDREIMLRTVYKCHRASSSKPSQAAPGKKQYKSKAVVDCPYCLVCTIYYDDPQTVHYVEHFGHQGHEPGSIEDLRYLPLNCELEKSIKQVILKLNIFLMLMINQFIFSLLTN